MQITLAGGVRTAAGAALCLVFAIWVVKTSAVEALGRGSPGVAAAIFPAHPQPRLAAAIGDLDLGSGQLAPDVRQSALQALDLAPLAEAPFLIRGLEAVQSGRMATAEKLLVEARRRNPRLRPARLFLLDHYLRSGRLDHAGVELAALRRLVPGVEQALAPQLAMMVRDERTGASLIRMLSRDPGVQQAVLSSLASTGADPDLIMRVARAGPTSALASGGQPWQLRLLDALIARGEAMRAVRLWQTFSGLPEGGGSKGVYDGRFQKLPGSAPFNWSLYTGSGGSAERTRAPALDVQFFGRETAELASQLMVLAPGRYTLRFRVEGSAKGDDSRLAWRVACHGDNGDPLVEVPLRDVTAAPRTLSAAFAIPASCKAQTLRLMGIAGEFPGTQSVAIADVSIAPGGGSR